MSWNTEIVEEWRVQERRRHPALRALGVAMLVGGCLAAGHLAYVLAFGG